MARNQATVAHLVGAAIDLLPIGQAVSYPDFLSMIHAAGQTAAVAYMAEIRKSGRVKFSVIRNDDGTMSHNVIRES